MWPSRLLGRFKDRHQRLVARICAHPARAGWVAALIGLVALAGFASLRQRVAARFRERHYVLGIKGPPGASFDWMRATGMRISRGCWPFPKC
jgi:multidrug efflux pump subunit AcrB